MMAAAEDKISVLNRAPTCEDCAEWYQGLMGVYDCERYLDVPPGWTPIGRKICRYFRPSREYLAALESSNMMGFYQVVPIRRGH